jgi:ecotin
MMNTKLVQIFTVVAMLFSSGVFGGGEAALDAFPEAAEGMERLVIQLPHKERGEEDDFKVELIPGKVMLTDGVNNVRLGVTISPQPLKGWGYTYYNVTGSDAVMSTMMAAPEDAQKVEQFVQGKSLFIRYNSRLPIVVYVPEGHAVRYRLWNAGAIEVAEKG